VDDKDEDKANDNDNDNDHALRKKKMRRFKRFSRGTQGI
jgi:hypothetical protein